MPLINHGDKRDSSAVRNIAFSRTRLWFLELAWRLTAICNSSSRLSTALMDTLRGSYIHTGKHSDTEGKDKCIFLENYSAALSSWSFLFHLLSWSHHEDWGVKSHTTQIWNKTYYNILYYNAHWPALFNSVHCCSILFFQPCPPPPQSYYIWEQYTDIAS